MRRFSVRPTLTLKGRKFKGLRGWAGKPFHPPLTDIPVAAYVLAAAFDVISRIGRGRGGTWGVEFFHAATYTLVAGGIVSVFAALTGFWDWWRSSKPGNQARRTINTHAVIMVAVTALAAIDIGMHLGTYHIHTSPTGLILALSIVLAALVSLGATFGGTLVFDYGFNVETAGDSPVWHQSETDVLPGQRGPDG